MNEMITMPVVVGLIIGTALLSAVVTQSLPRVPKWWNALKNAIKRKSTRRRSSVDMVDVIIIAQLQERIDEMEEMMNEVAANSYRRENNRKNNIRREVRDYLKELQNSK
jgi:S-adenosylmethionine synthetase